MLKDMPADILTTAAAAVEAMPQRAPFKADVLEAIAKAIHAERERCAAIVDDYPDDHVFSRIYQATERDYENDPFWTFRGDSGNWAWLMGEVAKPVAAKIRGA